MAKKKDPNLIFKNKDAAKLFMTKQYEEAKSFKAKLDRKYFWIALKKSAEFRVARQLLGKAKPVPRVNEPQVKLNMGSVDYTRFGDSCYKKPSRINGGW